MAASTTQANITAVGAAVVAQVVAHAAIPTPVMNSRVAKFLTDLDSEVVAQAEWAKQLSGKVPSKH